MNRPLAKPLIERRTVAAEAAELLRHRILAGELRAGQPIRQEQIAQELGVSRIPLREALKQLEAEGLVAIAPHKGAVVASLSREEAEELFALRLQLETWLLREAIPRMREADFAHLDAIIDESRMPDADPGKLTRWGELNWRFHSTLYAAAGRPRTLATLANMHAHIDRFLRLQMSLMDGQITSRREHLAILAACKAGDGERAARLLAEHIQAVAATIVDFANRGEAGLGAVPG